MLYAALAILLLYAGAAVWRQTVGGRDREMRMAYRSVDRSAGYRLGQAIAEDIPSGSMIPVLYTEGFSHTGNDKPEAFINGLRRGADRKRYRFEPVEMEREMGEEAMYVNPTLDEAVIARVLQEYPEAAALISLIGRPALDLADMDTVPPLYLFGNFHPDDLSLWLEAGIARAGVIHRSQALPPNAVERGMSLEDIFDLRYQLLRSEN